MWKLHGSCQEKPCWSINEKEPSKKTWAHILGWESVLSFVALCPAVSKAHLFEREIASRTRNSSTSLAVWDVLVTAVEAAFRAHPIAYCSSVSFLGKKRKRKNFVFVFVFLQISPLLFRDSLSKICIWIQTGKLQIRYWVRHDSVLLDEETKHVD